MSKWREFWIDEVGDTVDGERDAVIHSNSPGNTTHLYCHVIEHGALLEAEAKLEELNQNCISLGLHESRMRESEERIKKLKAALKIAEGYMFMACQPDRGDLFGEFDDKMRAELSKAQGET